MSARLTLDILGGYVDGAISTNTFEDIWPKSSSASAPSPIAPIGSSTPFISPLTQRRYVCTLHLQIVVSYAAADSYHDLFGPNWPHQNILAKPKCARTQHVNVQYLFTLFRPSTADGQPVDHLLRDTFAILSSKFLRITPRRSEAEDPDDCTAADSVAHVKKKLLSKISHKNAMQNAIPILIALKSRFEKAHSPLLRQVTNYLQLLFQHHRSDIESALREDRQLAQEVGYDLRLLDNANRQNQRAKRPRESLSSPLASGRKTGTPRVGRTPLSAKSPCSTNPKQLSSCLEPSLRKRKRVESSLRRDPVSRNLNAELVDVSHE